MSRIPEDLSTWKEEEMIEYAKKLGKTFSSSVKTSQLRNVFSDINRIRVRWKFGELKEENLQKELLLIKPKLAYAAGRHRGGVIELKNELERAIDGVVSSPKKKEAANNFFHFVEAIVAYHKYYGGS